MTLYFYSNDESILSQFKHTKLYKKITPVKAIQIHEFFSVLTLKGIRYGDAGDYLCEGDVGEKWPVKKHIFEKTYEEIK